MEENIIITLNTIKNDKTVISVDIAIMRNGELLEIHTMSIDRVNKKKDLISNMYDLEDGGDKLGLIEIDEEGNKQLIRRPNPIICFKDGELKILRLGAQLDDLRYEDRCNGMLYNIDKCINNEYALMILDESEGRYIVNNIDKIEDIKLRYGLVDTGTFKISEFKKGWYSIDRYNNRDKKINTLVIPDFISVIKEDVLSNVKCNTINIGKNVRTIESRAFKECEAKTIILNDKLESIGNYAFEGSNVENIVIPKSVRKIGEKAFANCKNLKSITINTYKANIANNFILRSYNIDEIIIPKIYSKVLQDMIYRPKILCDIQYI